MYDIDLSQHNMQNARADMSNMITARQKTPKVFIKALNNGKY